MNKRKRIKRWRSRDQSVRMSRRKRKNRSKTKRRSHNRRRKRSYNLRLFEGLVNAV